MNVIHDKYIEIHRISSHSGEFMKRKSLHIFNILIVIVAVMLTPLGACGAKAPLSSTATDTQSRVSLAGFGNLSARLFGLATFEGYNQTIDWPIEYAVPPISISWMGNIFNGLLEGAGPGGYITYQVHGSVSDDGAWIESMFFSKKVFNPTSNTGVFFRVTLQNVPLVQTTDESGNGQAKSVKSGPDVQRFLTRVEYIFDPNFTYLGTNCGDTTVVAALSVTLATGPGIAAADGSETPPSGGSSGGMM
jgi:hypothetical protein